jgi:hypothetical protein
MCHAELSRRCTLSTGLLKQITKGYVDGTDLVAFVLAASEVAENNMGGRRRLVSIPKYLLFE